MTSVADFPPCLDLSLRRLAASLGLLTLFFVFLAHMKVSSAVHISRSGLL